MHIKKINQCKDQNELLINLDKYVKMAEEQRTSAVIINTNIIDINEMVKLKCRIPRCFHFQSCANCPPFTPDVEVFKKAIRKCNYAILIKYNVEPAEDFADRKISLKNAKLHERQIAKIVAEVEIAAFQDGYYLAMGLSCGSCRSYLCNDEICQFLDSGRCKFPRVARPSMEAMGIDVYKLVATVGWDIYPIGPEKVHHSTIPSASAVGIVFIA
ncbi:MAG: hypothetical protein VR69_00455 [Peptococcaceae bacterium BRH_c4b]|nr:MAG: hypothetical protein VR69_00455 [Peptococcaceae bacterium BRH_c4b]